MKKIIMLAFIALSGLVIACGKGEENTNTTNTGIEGNWYIESANIEGFSITISEFSQCFAKTFIRFSNGIVAATLYDEDYDGKCISERISGTYSVSGNAITIIWQNGDVEKATIKGNQMILSESFGRTKIGGTFKKR
ncbi:lipocalin family protein [Capnocytophaga canimorsus]|uniref:lipocalin family protein n=1 Tax=Capnocytophaga canimorsus TaxID=28188 RepID=UPI0037D3C810